MARYFPCRTLISISIVILFLLFGGETDAACPNSCSGHGECRHSVTCRCFAGYTGPDCSQRICSSGVAWTSKPHDIDNAHLSMECSNAGICDRNTGTCACFTGYTGQSCDRMTCPRSCSGHGRCVTTGQVYDFLKSNSSQQAVYYQWDADHTTTCLCDEGFTGAGCEMRMCPKGFDPLVTISDYFVITFTTSANSLIQGGYFRFEFNGNSFLFPGEASSWNAASCATAFEGLKNIDTVTCSRGTVNSVGGATYTVTFNKFSERSYESNFVSNDGTPSLDAFVCENFNVDNTTIPRCTVAIASTSNDIPEYKYCSGRGACNVFTGDCQCYPNFININCDTFEPDDTSSVYSFTNILEINANYAGFTNSIVTLSSAVPVLSTFYFFNISTATRDVFQMDSDGNIDMVIGGIIAGSSAEVRVGGMTSAAGVTVNSGGFRLLQADSKLVINSGLAVNGGFYTSGGLTIYSDGMYVGGGVTSAGAGLRMTGGLNIGAGGLTISRGGLTVTGGASITGGILVSGKGVSIQGAGLQVSGGVTIASNVGGLFVTGGGTIFQGGLAVTGAVTITGSAVVTGGVTIGGMGIVGPSLTLYTSGINLIGGTTVFTSGMTATGGLSINTDGLYIITGGLVSSGGLSMYSSGIAITGGATVQTGGMALNSGGLTIFDSGLRTTGGMTVSSGGILVSGGLTVLNAGMVITNGLTLADTGLYAQSGFTSANLGMSTISVTTNSGGMVVTGGGSVAAIGISVTGGLTIATLGLTVDSTISVFSGGLYVTGGQTIKYGGVTSTGGLSVLNSGAFITAGGTVTSDGLVVTGGVTLQNIGLVVSGGQSVFSDGVIATYAVVPNGGLMNLASLTSYSNGLQITGGMSITSGGLKITGGTTIYSGGLMVTGGLTVIDNRMYINADGLTIQNGGLVMSQGFTIYSIGSTITGGATVASGGFGVVAGGMTAQSAGMAATGGLTVLSDGLVVTGGATVALGSAYLYGGMTAWDGGLFVSGGYTLSSGGFQAVSMQVNSNGMIADSGLEIGSDGLQVTAGGTVFTGGAAVDGGMTVLNGAYLTTYLSVSSSGLSVTGGFSVQQGGLVMTGGLTVFDGGINILSMTVKAGGVTTTGGISVGSSGGYIQGSLTIADGMATTGLFATGDGLVCNDGVTVNSAGVLVSSDDGVTIASGGLFVSSGATIYGVPIFSNAVQTSDERLKINIEPIASPLDRISKVRGVYYDWLHSNAGNNVSITNSTLSYDDIKSVPWDNDRHVGVIAQEVQRVLPEAVGDIENGKYLGVRYEDLIPLLVAGVNELTMKYQPAVNKDCDYYRSKIREIKSRIQTAKNEERILQKYLDFIDELLR